MSIIGKAAPSFSSEAAKGGELVDISLDDYKGKWLTLFFYPLDFSPTCSDQLSIYQEVLGEIEAQGAAVIGVSVDSFFAHRAFREQLGQLDDIVRRSHAERRATRHARSARCAHRGLANGECRDRLGGVTPLSLRS